VNYFRLFIMLPMVDSNFESYYASKLDPYCNSKDCIVSLKKHNIPVLLVLSKHTAQVKALWNFQGLDYLPLEWYPHAVTWPKALPFGEKLPGFDEGFIYPLNASSILPPLTLGVTPGEIVLDGASAPGGKTLVLWQQMMNEGLLVANDMSYVRLMRQKNLMNARGIENVVFESQPLETLYKKYPETFDAILLDAPCSSEKHVLAKPEELTKWTPQRIKNLAKRQIQLFDGAIKALRIGGRIVYSTCALLADENEDIVSNILAMHPELQLESWELDDVPGMQGFEVIGNSFDPKNVRRILPHIEKHMDPMFIAKFVKN